MSKTIDIPVQVPDWARWVAQDEIGAWCAYENKPIAGDMVWRCSHGRIAGLVDHHAANPNWRETLREVE